MTDTHPDMEQRQLELLRAATVAQRTELALSLSAEVITLARRAIGRAHPDWTTRQVDLEFVALHYGPELAKRLAALPGPLGSPRDPTA